MPANLPHHPVSLDGRCLEHAFNPRNSFCFDDCPDWQPQLLRGSHNNVPQQGISPATCRTASSWSSQICRYPEMCHFARTDFRCGDWRWGNMRSRCPWQPHIGETCGVKLSDTDDITFVDTNCKLCQQIGIEQRRIERLTERLGRWEREEAIFPASIEKAEGDIMTGIATIRQLQHRRPSVLLSKQENAAQSGQPERTCFSTKTPRGDERAVAIHQNQPTAWDGSACAYWAPSWKRQTCVGNESEVVAFYEEARISRLSTEVLRSIHNENGSRKGAVVPGLHWRHDLCVDHSGN